MLVAGSAALVAGCALPARQAVVPAGEKPAAELAPSVAAAEAVPTRAQLPPPVSFPTRPVSLICPWEPRDAAGAIGRSVASQLEEQFGQPVNVANLVGGGGGVGHVAGATAAPDGYTLTLITTEIVLLKWLGLAWVTPQDFVPLAMVSADPLAIYGRTNARWRALKEMLEDARATGRKLKASGGGKGGIGNLARAATLKALGLPLDAILWEPAEGVAAALESLERGAIDLVICTPAESSVWVEARVAMPLACLGPRRHPGCSDAPTLREQGVDLAFETFCGFGLPVGAKPELVSLYERALKGVYDSVEFQRFMRDRGYGMRWEDSRGFGAYMEKKFDAMGRLAREIGPL